MRSVSPVSILITGSEVMDGRVQDSNSRYIAARLADQSLPLRHILCCGDDLYQIKNALEYLSKSSAAIVLSGGLGPTSDDVTREAVAAFAGVPLQLDQGVLAEIGALYKSRGRPFDETNTRQAYFPAGASVIKNPIGTAPGFAIPAPQAMGACMIFVLPGVPRELQLMFEQSVEGALRALLGNPPLLERSFFRIFGMAESLVGARVESCKLSDQIKVSYRAHFPEIQLLLSASDLEDAPTRVSAAIGTEYIVTTDAKITREAALQMLLIEKGKTIAIAESCTGGLLGACLTETPGSSSCFLGGTISYSNEVKVAALGVSLQSLECNGAVSNAVACQMALGARTRHCADIAVSISGVAGPDGGSEEKPVGTFFIGFSDENETIAYKYFLPLERARIRAYAAAMALDVVRRKLLSLPIHSLT